MTLELSHPALHRAVRDLDAAAERLRADQEDADRRVGVLLDGGWSGAAAEAYAAAWSRWRAGARDVLDGLVTHRRLLVATHHDLAATDQRAADRSRAAGRLLERLG